MSDGFICFLPRSVQRSLWFPISRSSLFSHILPAAPSSCVEKGEANAWSRLQVASFFSSQIPERQWQKRSSSSAGPRSLAILAEHVIKKLLSSKKITYRPPLVTARASLHMNNQELSHESSLQSGTCQSLFSPENPVFYNFGF